MSIRDNSPIPRKYIFEQFLPFTRLYFANKNGKTVDMGPPTGLI